MRNERIVELGALGVLSILIMGQSGPCNIGINVGVEECGDGVCGDSENANSCCQDCGVCGPIEVNPGPCWLDPACFDGGRFNARHRESGNCVSIDEGFCTLLDKCEAGSCSNGGSDCTISPGCGEGVQRCNDGICTSISPCNGRIKFATSMTPGYADDPGPNQCDCSETTLDVSECSIDLPFSQTWRQVARDGEGPSPRGGMGLAYDSVRQVVVLFGGYGEDRKYLGDTWEWNGTSWTMVASSDPTGVNAPSPRAAAAMAYDSQSRSIILFGGNDGSYPEFFGDTWKWSGAGWMRVATGSTSPQPRTGSVLAADRTGRLLLFGGQGGSGNTFDADTWSWNGTSWSELETLHGPPGRTSFGMAYDSTRRETVLYGGVLGHSVPAHDTWCWNGSTWRDCTPTDSEYTPSPSAPAMAHDPISGLTVLFGGESGAGSSIDYDETWLWDGETWTQVMDVPDRPSPRFWAGMTFDSARNTIMLFGGSHSPSSGSRVEFGDTWLFGAPGD